MSVYLADILGDYRIAMRDHDEFALVVFSAGEVRECHQSIMRTDPKDPDHDGDPSHVYVVGEKTKSIKKCLRSKAQWVFRPDDWSDVNLT